jgi:hypothetical protein
METVLSILLGGLITIVVSWNFYVRAAKDLRAETVRLRQRVDLVLSRLENAGIVELSRDQSGDIRGINVTIHLPGIPLQTKVFPPTVTTEPSNDEAESGDPETSGR